MQRNAGIDSWNWIGVALFVLLAQAGCGTGEGTIGGTPPLPDPFFEDQESHEEPLTAFAAQNAPRQSSSGPGGAAYAHQGFARTTVSAWVMKGSTPLDVGFHLFEPTQPAAPLGPARVILYLHGGCFSDDRGHLAHIQHLVRRGHFVVFPTGLWLPYAYNPQVALQALRGALTQLAARGYVRPTVSYVGFSSGGMVALQAGNDGPARAALDLPAPSAIIALDAAGGNTQLYSWMRPLNLSGIPANTRLMFILSESSYQGAQKDGRKCNYDWSQRSPSEGCGAWSIVSPAWKSAGQVPRSNKSAVVVLSDAFPRSARPAIQLQSTHEGCLAGSSSTPLDAIDWYGYWKTTDLALSAAQDLDRGSVDLETLPDPLTYMGRYASGEEVRRMLIISEQLR